MREIPKNFKAPILGVWVGAAPSGADAPHPGCAVFVSHATSRLRVDVDRLSIGLSELGLRFEGLTRSHARAVPPGLPDVVETLWDGGDPVDVFLTLARRIHAPSPKPSAQRARIHATV